MTLHTALAEGSPLLMIESTARLADAFTQMKTAEVRHLLVSDDEKVVGILSDRDLLMALQFTVEDLFDYEVTHTSFDPKLTVRHVMSWPVQTIDARATLLETLDKILLSKKSSLLVTDGPSRITGIVTTQDILQAFRVHLTGSKERSFGGASLDSPLAQTPIAELLRLLKS